MKPTHVTKGGVQVATKGRPEVVLGQARIRCYRLTGGFHGWIKVTQLTPVTRPLAARALRPPAGATAAGTPAALAVLKTSPRRGPKRAQAAITNTRERKTAT